jgi:hypothetical protein
MLNSGRMVNVVIMASIVSWSLMNVANTRGCEHCEYSKHGKHGECRCHCRKELLLQRVVVAEGCYCRKGLSLQGLSM